MYRNAYFQKRRRTRFAPSAIVCARLALWVLVAGVFFRLIGFVSAAEAVLLIGFASALAGLAIILSLFAVSRIWFGAFSGVQTAISAFVLALVALSPLLVAGVLALTKPLTNDVATLAQEPPRLYISLASSQERNGLLGVPVAAPTMPNSLFPVRSSLRSEEVASFAKQIAEQEGWELSAEFSSNEGMRRRLAFTDKTLVLGFVDDIIVEIRDSGERAEIHVRSASRLGKSDLGANEKRIRRFLNKISLAMSSATLSN